MMTQMNEILIKNACYSKQMIICCKQNNKRSLLMQKPAVNGTSLVSKSLPV